MRRTLIAMAFVAVAAVACEKTGENEYQVETPDVDVSADTSTIRTPDVDVNMDTARVPVPDVDVRRPPPRNP